ncbi:inactive serine/threonine-protein kinase TEX14 isoform C [Alligator mississippiensis]|uniref:Inactive serine/threonine-protein kinase TEX14 n=1 Tax=Alligator mississippiensis TaxID=8496 RepID=A0A151N6N6_ALLMI|nr:inactive serine/threonine-protein kinase TEX14 isoform C [Alligator mississippiensis]
MSHLLPLPVPCPVSLGTVRRDGPEAELHEAVRRGSRAAVKKLLKRGIHVDAVNSLGQTALFTAALFGLGKIVDVLLDYGSDPNHRCYDGSTPVHAAAFSGNQGVLSKLLDVGGDLRVHDKDGRTPQCWALSAGKETSAQMLEFMQRCASHMQAAIQNFPSDLLRKTDSSKVLICGPGRFGGLVQGIADSPLGKFLKGGANSSRNIYSFGFGKFHLTGNKQLGYLASLPIIGDREVFQADDEPTFSYHTGPYMLMTNLMWGGSRVTVKELNFKPHQNCSKLRLADLLIAEQEHSSKLRHPHLLQLMAVCLSSDLEKTRLVYERVSFGSLYSILHERRSEFPVLYMETIVFLLLQINDALRFLHARGFVHRSLTSYAVQIVSAGEAKLTNLEYTLESKEGGEHIDLTRVAVPAQLYRWCSPEVILQKAATVKSDIYSFCTVMQEALTETLPWSGQEDSFIKELIVSRQYLNTDVRLPKPYYDIVKTGLEAKQKDRSISLQDIRYTLQNDLKDLIAARMDRPGESSHAQGHSLSADVNIYLGSESKYQRSTLELQGEAIVESACSYTVPRCSVSPAKKGTVLDHEAMVSVQPGLHDLSQDVASNLQRTFSASDVNESLCSFEMNEIYAYYSEFHENAMEGQAEIECALGAEIEKQNVEEVGPSNQQLHPRVSVRRKRNVNLQHESGGDTSSAGSAVEEEIWRLPKSASEISNRRILSEERRMVQPEWTTEVKQMAKRAVSGQLGLLPPYAPSECTSESEAESLKETYLQATIKDRGYPEWQRRAGRWQTGSGTETLDLGRKEKSESEWSDAESIFESFAGRNGQSPSKDEQAESGTASHKNSDISRGSQNLSRGHSRVLDHSSDSSPDLSDEFFTPDPDEFFPPVTQDSSEVETSSSEGELEITPKACVPNQIGADAESGRKKFLCNTAKENLSNNTVGVNQLSHMPVASVEAAQEMIPGEALEEFKENYISLTDIQDLSSISYERENSSKDSTCKTPRVGHAPTSVSTPLSPEKKVSSSAKKYRNTHEIPLDTSCWSTQETALTASSTFTTACEKQRSAELPFVPLESSSLGLTEPSGLSGLGAASSLIKARKEFGKPISTTEQIDLEKADLIPAFSQASDHFMDELPPPAQELLDEIEYLKQQTAASQEKGSCSSRVPVKAPSQCQLADKEEAEEIENQGEVDHTVWTKETLNQTEETERAHSTLDDALERLLHPIAEADKVQGGPEGLPLRATSLKDQGEEGMKSGIEESSTRAESRETESRAGNTEATYLEDQKPKLRQRLPWTSPVRVIVLDQSSPPK